MEVPEISRKQMSGFSTPSSFLSMTSKARSMSSKYGWSWGRIDPLHLQDAQQSLHAGNKSYCFFFPGQVHKLSFSMVADV